MKRNLGGTLKIHVFRFRLGNRNNHTAFPARFMRNETIMSCFFPGFSSIPVHPGNNP